MKKRNMYLLFALLLVVQTYQSMACSMVKLRVGNKVFVGNNEDFWNPNTYMWTLPAKKHKMGVVYFGYDNFFAQGGINEAGLVFDGFAMNYLAVKNTHGKKKMSLSKLVNRIMTSCKSIMEVKKILERYNLSALTKAQLMFVDREGKSLIVEGDEFLESADDHNICTNFYQSQVKSTNDITCWRYKAGQHIIKSTPNWKQSADYTFCRDILHKMHQQGPWGGTQYSNVYDVKDGIIYLYLFHNFKEEVKLDVKQLVKSKKKVRLSTLFKTTQRYQEFAQKHQALKNGMKKLEKPQNTETLQTTVQGLKSNPLSQVVLFDPLTQFIEKHRQKKRYDQALIIAQLGIELFPKAWQFPGLMSGIFLRRKALQKADQYCRQAEKLSPHHPEVKNLRKKITELKNR